MPAVAERTHWPRPPAELQMSENEDGHNCWFTDSCEYTKIINSPCHRKVPTVNSRNKKREINSNIANTGIRVVKTHFSDGQNDGTALGQLDESNGSPTSCTANSPSGETQFLGWTK